jgi:SAM-dependent methyltransferase
MRKQELYNKDYIENHTINHFLYLKPIVHGLNKIIKPKRLLDIGCGKGFLIFCFHKLNKEAYGVDVSSYAINHSPLEIRKNLFLLDVEKNSLPFPNNYFDLITLLDVLEHLHFSSINHLFKEIKRVLIPSGFICITLPTKREEKRDITHINLRPKEFWIDFLKEHGFLLVNRKKSLLKKESRRYIWGNKKQLMKYFNEIDMKNIPHKTCLGKYLAKTGRFGCIIRKLLWLYNYFFRFNHYYFEKMMLFKKN